MSAPEGLPMLIDVDTAAAADGQHRTLTRVNDAAVSISVLQGETEWHRHDHEDGFFMVLDGEMTVDVEGGESLTLMSHQACMMAAGTLHRVRAATRTVVLLVEQADDDHAQSSS